MFIWEKIQKHILTVFLNTSEDLLVSGIFLSAWWFGVFFNQEM